MGLSRDSEVSMYQVLLDIAGTLKALVSDPEALDKAIKDAYALPEKEQAKADAARADLQTYRDLIDQQQKQLDDIAAQQKSLNDDKAKLSTDQDALGNAISSLAASRDVLAKDILAFNAYQESLDGREDRIAQKEDRLTERSADLDARENNLNDFETSLKSRAGKFKELTEGL